MGAGGSGAGGGGGFGSQAGNPSNIGGGFGGGNAGIPGTKVGGPGGVTGRGPGGTSANQPTTRTYKDAQGNTVVETINPGQGWNNQYVVSQKVTSPSGKVIYQTPTKGETQGGGSTGTSVTNSSPANTHTPH